MEVAADNDKGKAAANRVQAADKRAQVAGRVRAQAEQSQPQARDVVQHLHCIALAGVVANERDSKQRRSYCRNQAVA